MFGLDGQKGRPQPGEVTDLLIGDLCGVGRHNLHERRPLGAKLLHQSGVLCHRSVVVIHRVGPSDGAVPNPPAAPWQQRAVLTCSNAEFCNGYPWGAAFCTLSPAQPADGSIARPGPATSSTP